MTTNKNQGIDWTKKDMYDGIGRPDLRPIKPVGCFDSYEDYSKQFDSPVMRELDERIGTCINKLEEVFDELHDMRKLFVKVGQ